MTQTALIFGAGSGISASFARLAAKNGYKLALAARRIDKLQALAAETGAQLFAADSTRLDQVSAVFTELDRTFGRLDVVLYNAAARVRGPTAELDPAAVANAINVTAYGGFLVAQQAAQRMLKQGGGTILFTGASASVKGYPLSAAFAMGKFALRGLAQSMARELAPQGIHVAHFVIDGGVRNAAGGRLEKPGETPDSLLDPDAIAHSYLHVLQQPRSAWSWEVELRPWVERF
jgi:NAD(P)-dependent dehydrogenase (short-subunit alcohol dehydrogenase family)